MTTQVKYRDQSVMVNGLKLHYLEWGDPSAPALVTLHGLRGHSHSWDSFSEPMSEEYHVLALDQRGRGESDWASDKDYTAAAYVKDLEGFCDALGLRDFVLAGHSMGGLNAILFTGRHPSRVRKLILVDIGPEGDPSGGARIRRELLAAKEEYDSFEELLQQQQKANPLITPELLRRRLTYQTRELPGGKIGWRYDLEICQQWREDRRPPLEDLWPAFSQITCPTLIARGEETDILPLHVAQRMVKVVPNSRLAHIPRAAHMVMEENPSQFLQAARDFLQE